MFTIDPPPPPAALAPAVVPPLGLGPELLLVDDDPAITEGLAAYLARFGFVVRTAGHAAEMREQLARHPISLVVLDLMLPGTDGLTLARELRQRSTIPIIMLTARGDAADRVVGLEVGADDYMGKPFEPRELVARIQSVLRRAPRASRPVEDETVVAFDGWTLHRQERQLHTPLGVVVQLSQAEHQLLEAFLRAPRRVVTREHLAAQSRRDGASEAGRSVDLLVSRLRHKLGGPASGADDGLIRTVRGEGYRFEARAVQRGSVLQAH